MSDEKKVTTTKVFIGDKHLGQAMHDKIAQKKLTTQHIKDTLDEQSGAGKKPEPAPDSKKEG